MVRGREEPRFLPLPWSAGALPVEVDRLRRLDFDCWFSHCRRSEAAPGMRTRACVAAVRKWKHGKRGWRGGGLSASRYNLCLHFERFLIIDRRQNAPFDMGLPYVLPGDTHLKQTVADEQ